MNTKNEKRKVESRIVGWGKYRGRAMRNIPTKYLEWFIGNAYFQMTDRKRWATEELNRRKIIILNK